MLRTTSFKISLLSAACAAGLVAQGAPESANPRFNDPPPPPAGGYYPAPANVPATLTLPSGAYVTVRVNDHLSSDRNQPGDTFYATLAQPLIIDGIVVARQGSTVMGRISTAQKAGRVEGTSKLGLQLTNLSLVDGGQIAIQSQVIDRNGRTSEGRDAAGIAQTTGLGAIIGAAAGGGQGAAIGAGSGAAVGILGVLLTRGRATEIYPETMLTFRLDAPVSINTTHSAAAFRYAEQEDYNVPQAQPRMASRPPRQMGPPAGVYGRPYPYYEPYYSPYYYGGGFSVFVGPRYGGGRYYRGRR